MDIIFFSVCLSVAKNRGGQVFPRLVGCLLIAVHQAYLKQDFF